MKTLILTQGEIRTVSMQPTGADGVRQAKEGFASAKLHVGPVADPILHDVDLASIDDAAAPDRLFLQLSKTDCETLTQKPGCFDGWYTVTFSDASPATTIIFPCDVEVRRPRDLQT